MAENKSTIHTAKVTFGDRNTSNALLAFWEKAEDRLTDEECRWFSSLSGHAEQKAHNLSETLDAIGGLIAMADKTYALGQHQIASLLFAASAQADTIAGLIAIADYANSRLLEPELYAKTTREGAL